MRLPSRLPIVLRHLVSASSLLLFALLASCGGGTDTPAPPTAPGPGPTPPPPPPPPPVPTVGPPHVVAVRTGDGQTADPGTTLAIAPSVVVRDSAGRPVPNVVVVFRVDSGGGVITGDTDTTTTDGVASASAWRLGPSEGRQVLAATAGSLTSARFVAVASVTPVTLPPQSLPMSGGTVTLSRPGSPMHGLSLEVPPNAVRGATAITFGVQSAADIAVPPGHVRGGPLVQISATGAVLSEPLLLTVPIASEPGMLRIISVVDNARGRLTPLPAVDWDANGVTVALSVLDEAAQAGAAAGGSSGVHNVNTGLGILTVLVPAAALEDALDTGFRPGVDDWDFPRQRIAGIPNRSPGPTVDPAGAMVESASWYFTTHKPTDGPLSRRFQRVRGVPESNRAGLRWMGLAGSRLSIDVRSTGAYSRFVNRAPAPPSSFAHENVALHLRVAMAGGIPIMGGAAPPKTPTPVALYSGSSPDAPRFGLAFAAEGDVISLALPEEPGRTFRVQFTPSGIVPFTVTTEGGASFTVTGVSGTFMSLANRQSNERLFPDEWTRVVAGTIGDREGWPTPKLRGVFRQEWHPEPTPYQHIDVDPNDVLVGVPFTHWWECSGCTDHGFRLGMLGGDVNALLLRALLPLPSGTTASLPTQLFAQMDENEATVLPDLRVTGGVALYQPGPGSGPSAPQAPAWFDWTEITYRRVPVTLTSDLEEAGDEGPVVFTASVTGAPAGASYLWQYEGRQNEQGEVVVKEYFTTSTPTLTYQLSRSKMQLRDGEYHAKMRVIVVDANKRAVGDDDMFLRLDSGRLTWRLTSFAITGGDPLGDGGLGSIVPEAAHEWVLFVFLEPSAESGGAPVPGAYLQRIPPGQPVVFSRTDPSVIALANRERDAQRNVAGVFTWTGTGSSGSVEGSGSPGRFSCGPFPFEGTRQFFRTIRANKTGATLGGVISSRIDRTSGCAGGASDDMMTANFVARRVP
jgi:hypothetical protein